MAAAEIIAFHGWGFDAGCWEPWKKRYEQADMSLRCAERGYFGASPETPVFSSLCIPAILMVHSFGLHSCPEQLLEQADLLVIFGGFHQFHPVAAQYRRRSRQVIRQMMDRLQEEPEKVLEDFYANTYLPQQAPPFTTDTIKVPRLLADLRQLDIGEVNLGRMKRVDKICILHGFKDRIVPRAKGRELYNSLRKQARYFEVKEAGHALPFTHTEQCFDFLKPEIAELIS